MLTKDDVHNCCLDAQNGQNAQKTGVQNTNLDDVLLGKRVKIARKEKQLTHSIKKQPKPLFHFIIFPSISSAFDVIILLEKNGWRREVWKTR